MVRTSVTGDYDFLDALARKIATAVQIPCPKLDKAAPYADFKEFLLGLKTDITAETFLVDPEQAVLPCWNSLWMKKS